MARYDSSNARVAREYGVDPDGVLFRDTAPARDAAPAPARWADLPEYERRLVRRHVRDRAGVDIDPGAPESSGDRLAVRARVAGGCLRRITRLPGQWRLSDLRDLRLVAGWLSEVIRPSTNIPERLNMP